MGKRMIFAWACLMYNLAGWVQALGYNHRYSYSTNQLIGAIIQATEEKREEELLRELHALRDDFIVTYENEGNYPELALQFVQNLNQKAEPIGVDSD